MGWTKTGRYVPHRVAVEAPLPSVGFNGTAHMRSLGVWENALFNSGRHAKNIEPSETNCNRLHRSGLEDHLISLPHIPHISQRVRYSLNITRPAFSRAPNGAELVGRGTRWRGLGRVACVAPPTLPEAKIFVFEALVAALERAVRRLAGSALTSTVELALTVLGASQTFPRGV